ncbi:MAG: FlgD immunoglobulin-like domain containing protein, partial [Candidatus Cloacimonetes bacterium]|nr:FlgD immunoglobulin-like domain containing protein [Candidatus Cloacimonadota bacterium]
LTEHNLRGFYINRGPTELLTHAILVSPLIAAANAPFSYNFEDREIPSDGAWYYWLQGIDLQGNSQLFGPVGVNVSTGSGEPPEPSLGTGITSLYPNPFSPNLKISYEIIEQNPVLFTIRIYNSRGQLVRNLVRTTKENCKESIFWDGKDDSGTDCSSGIYLIYMQAGSKESHKKAIMIK